jgi:uncharacterized glyoxalase superfamily protein PhnB
LKEEAMSKPQAASPYAIKPHLVITGGAKAVEWYQKALSAKLLTMTPMPDGRLMHAELAFGDATIMVADSFPERGQQSPKELGGTPVVISLQVPDCDKIWKQAIEAGATVRFPINDMFWGDRYGQIVDPFGHVWGISTHKEDVSPAELDQRAKAAMKQMH